MRTSSLAGAFIISLLVASALTPVRAADMTSERVLNPQREPQTFNYRSKSRRGDARQRLDA
jgi:hypothetical protein